MSNFRVIDTARRIVRNNIINLNDINSLKNYLENFERNNISTILLNSHFENGTVRITKSGVYKLGENISFKPNTNNDFMPTQEQIDSGLYPVKPLGPYHMGFFAAIAIETDNVILDLNGYRIDQSLEHQIQQRFFDIIELGSSPFIPKQGPSNFGDSIVCPKSVWIKNGVLGKTSHTCLHGNNAIGVIVTDLLMTDFEFSGWGLNGCKNVL